VWRSLSPSTCWPVNVHAARARLAHRPCGTGGLLQCRAERDTCSLLQDDCSYGRNICGAEWQTLQRASNIVAPPASSLSLSLLPSPLLLKTHLATCGHAETNKRLPNNLPTAASPYCDSTTYRQACAWLDNHDSLWSTAAHALTISYFSISRSSELRLSARIHSDGERLQNVTKCEMANAKSARMHGVRGPGYTAWRKNLGRRQLEPRLTAHPQTLQTSNELWRAQMGKPSKNISIRLPI
jgi:hypothetical protein